MEDRWVARARSRTPRREHLFTRYRPETFFPVEPLSTGVLAFEFHGRGGDPCVVLLHGWPLDRTIWSEAALIVAGAGFRVVALDLPGFGESPSLEAGRETVEALAEEVARFLTSFAPGRVALAGHSFGGYVALAFAERHPDLLAGLGLVASRTLADSEATRKGRHETIAKVRAQGSRALLPDLARKLLSPSAPQPLLDRATRMIERARPDGVIAGLAAMAARPDRTAVLESFAGPALVLHGSEDQLIPEWEAAHPKGSRTVVRQILAGVGHMPMWETPQATAEAVLRWGRAAHEG